ncbi:MAG: leucine-rich repeat protein [Bacilli bacterium]|jgi:CheY-like chemotaxis protein|nr:leucine-rich repeat protein [Bacilli bacterium]
MTADAFNDAIEKGQQAGMNAHLTKPIDAEKITTIGVNAFNGCAFTSLKLNSSLTSVGASAFLGNESLTELEIDVDTSILGANSFSACNALTSLTFAGQAAINNPSSALPPVVSL